MNTEILNAVKKYRNTFGTGKTKKEVTERKQAFTNKLKDLFSLCGVVKPLKGDERGWFYAFREDNGFKYYMYNTYLDKQGNKWSGNEIYIIMNGIY